MLNKVQLIGRLGQDPELKYTQGGQGLATDESWTDKQGEKQKRTEWHRVTAWAKLGENCAKFLAKGKLAYVEGKIQSREYEDKSGQKRTAYEIVASEVKFLSPKDEGAPSGGGYQPPAQPSTPATDRHNDDDIPFLLPWLVPIGAGLLTLGSLMHGGGFIG